MTAVEEGRSVDPLEGLDASQRAELVDRAAHWADPLPGALRKPGGGGKGRRGRGRSGDPVQVPVGGMVGVLARFGAVPPESVRAMLAAEGVTDEQLAEAEERYRMAARLFEEADAEARAAADKVREANRCVSYLRNRSPRYADAAYAMLRPEQDPSGLVSSWLGRGPATLTLAGAARTGKTTAAYAITNDANDRGLWVEVWTAKKIAEGLRDDKQATWQRVTGCDVLMLDDLGRERVTDWWRDFLQELVDDRFGGGATGKRMIVTANTPTDQQAAYDDLLARYGDPIVERILDHGGILIFDGPAIRNLVTTW